MIINLNELMKTISRVKKDDFLGDTQSIIQNVDKCITKKRMQGEKLRVRLYRECLLEKFCLSDGNKEILETIETYVSKNGNIVNSQFRMLKKLRQSFK